MPDKIAIVAFLGLLIAGFLSPIPWDIWKEHKAKQEKQEQRAEDNRRQADEQRARDINQRLRICAELKLRYELFQGRMHENDRTGALRAMDNPDGRFRTTSPELTVRLSGDLFNELFRLAGMRPQVDISAWPPSNETPRENIQIQAAAFMNDVARACN